MKTLNIVAISLVLFFLGCGREKSETTTRGRLRVLIAESALPPIADQVREFLNLYGNDGAVIVYESTSSDQAIQRLGRDSVRFIITTRPMTAAERQHLPDISGYELSDVLVAYDGMAVVVHGKSPVDKITTTELTGILAGDIGRWEQLSHANAMRGKIELVVQDSSDVTLFIDARLLHGKPLRKDIRLTSSSLTSLQSIAAQPAAIGLVGVTWVDSAHVSVKVVDIGETRTAADTSVHVPSEALGKFYSPHPANVYRSYYPLKRAIYSYCYAPLGSLASGFGAYVANKEGQRIFLKRNLVPGTQPIRLKGTE